ncbi:Dynamin family protein [Quadrisphaera granulorum]|uniref:Dynamin family protein n=1 Tax=Quadrisphaera granulorum TaxID=317664 RepID=A0A315ZRA7_9ACTN|nr:dynamin family protein [Quadrisphaera granulorum]SZE98835.1 Dynamin family protein [Quadrisphaera granulorum]
MPTSASSLLEPVEQLRVLVADLDLPLDASGADRARAERDQLLAQLDDYLLPRLRRLDAPLLAVVGGSTGAGKSTLVNSFVGRQVTTSGVLRPTTRYPVLVHSPADAAHFLSDAVLPGLARTTGSDVPDPTHPSVAGAKGLRLVEVEHLPAGLALLDAPDVDSVVESNRDLAVQLLGAADLWLFTTTAARYADAVPWEVLRTATERGTAVAVVLDRIPPEALAEVRTDLARMLAEAGLKAAPLFTIAECSLEAGLLPRAQMAPLRRWLAGISVDARSRDVVVRRTLSGALVSLATRVPRLADAADAQDAEERSLLADLHGAYADATEGLQDHLSDGTLLRGEVLARWQEFVGTGELFASLQAGVGRVRDRIAAAVRRKAPPADRLGEALVTGVAALVIDAAGSARQNALLRWRARPSGAAVLANAPDGASDPQLRDGFTADVERLVRDWQQHVLDLVRAQGEGKRSRALFYSLGVSGAGAVLMLVVFAASAGLTGAEAGIAALTAALAQRVLEAAFGDQAVRQLAAAARADLIARVEALLDDEQHSLAQLLPERLGTQHGEAEIGSQLRQAAAAVARAGDVGRGSAA